MAARTAPRPRARRLLFGPDPNRPPLIGRRHELRVLEQSAFREDGRGCVLLVCGDSGDGVTRFIEEAHRKCLRDFPGHRLKKSAVLTIDGGHLGWRDPFGFIVDLRNMFVGCDLSNNSPKPVDLDLVIFDDLARSIALLFDLGKPKLERSPTARALGKGIGALAKLGTAGLWDMAQTLVQLSNLAQTGVEEVADAVTKTKRAKLASAITKMLGKLGSGPASDFIRALVKGNEQHDLDAYLRALSAELLYRIAAFAQPGKPVLFYLLVDAFDLIEAEAHFLPDSYGVHDLVQQAIDDVITEHGLAIVGGRATGDPYAARLAMPSSEELSLRAISWSDVEHELGDKACTALRDAAKVALVAGSPDVHPVAFATLWRKHAKAVAGEKVT